ncbi:hypothetical protein CDD83_1236 [Cordyceps sp. RAO-2017]|nr:hypothetical protein CDD83_1236 [Cordyceps sp. RAO-2017]
MGLPSLGDKQPAKTPAAGAKPAPAAAPASGKAPAVKPEDLFPTIIHLTDGKVDKEAYFLKLHKLSLDDEILSDLRINIAGLTESIELSHLPFCLPKGAVVPDSFSIQDYLKSGLGVATPPAPLCQAYHGSSSR